MFSLVTLFGFVALASATKHWDVVVGGPDILKFDPPYVNAHIGDKINFIFKQKNHTLTQSSFASPCSPLAYGFDTGFNQFVPPEQKDNFPVVTLTVNSTAPAWYYCKQGDHCSQGMVFAVNPGHKFDEFKKRAKATGKPDPSCPPVAPPHAPVNHKVTVGGPNVFVFDPDHITAKPDDTITFIFQQKNHTVTQSSFGMPCSPLHGGFDSGFMPVADNITSDFPTYTVKVKDTKPIWAYCRQGDHCPVRGMVFSVNAVEPNNHEAFKAKATSTPPGPAPGAPAPTGY